MKGGGPPPPGPQELCGYLPAGSRPLPRRVVAPCPGMDQGRATTLLGCWLAGSVNFWRPVEGWGASQSSQKRPAGSRCEWKMPSAPRSQVRSPRCLQPCGAGLRTPLNVGGREEDELGGPHWVDGTAGAADTAGAPGTAGTVGTVGTVGTAARAYSPPQNGGEGRAPLGSLRTCPGYKAHTPPGVRQSIHG